MMWVRLVIPSSLLALLATATISFGSFFYVHHGKESLGSLDNSVGEMMFFEAERLEQAGFAEAALIKYEAALKSRFNDPKNRDRAIKARDLLRSSRVEKHNT